MNGMVKMLRLDYSYVVAYKDQIKEINLDSFKTIHRSQIFENGIQDMLMNKEG